ncbi:DNA-binding protein [Neobacillus sp. BF23-41]|uniref:DNA-binding protein n=1 Tax=Neobacillus sp. BF23-41 TaxID=3240280 RepID=UPI0034E5F4E7
MSKKAEDFPVVLNAKNISEIMKVSLRTAYEIMDYPDFPLIKIGRCKRVENESFLAWIEQQTLKKVN